MRFNKPAVLLCVIIVSAVMVDGYRAHFGMPYVSEKRTDTLPGGTERSARVSMRPWLTRGDMLEYCLYRWEPEDGGYSLRENVLRVRSDGTMHFELDCLEKSAGRDKPVTAYGCRQDVVAPGENPEFLKIYLREDARKQFDAYRLLDPDLFLMPKSR